MTIAEKLSKILDIKQQCLQAIRNKGVELSDDDPFENYPSAIESISQAVDNYTWNYVSPSKWMTTSQLSINVSYSSALDSTTIGSKAFDGNSDTYWHSKQNDSSPKITINLLKPIRSYGLSIQSRVYGGYPQILPSKGTIYGSNNGTNFVKITSFTISERLDDGKIHRIYFLEPVEYQYYRIADLNTGYVGFAEVEFLVPEKIL